jgi:hypothetical protein
MTLMSLIIKKSSHHRSRHPGPHHFVTGLIIRISTPLHRLDLEINIHIYAYAAAAAAPAHLNRFTVAHKPSGGNGALYCQYIPPHLPDAREVLPARNCGSRSRGYLSLGFGTVGAAPGHRRVAC